MPTEALSNGLYLLLFFATLFVVTLVLGALVGIYEHWHKRRRTKRQR